MGGRVWVAQQCQTGEILYYICSYPKKTEGERCEIPGKRNFLNVQ